MYDLVPHSWILEILKLYEINSKVYTFLQKSMSYWNTIRTVNGMFVVHVHIKCGILQGDSISPLLFCLALNPLSEVLKSARYGYALKSGQVVQHLLYMDNLKLYAKNERDLNALFLLYLSSDIGMKMLLRVLS